tara:strand:+ start:90 stop:569 length:480 start_codon:yes stop_codon:yes gene_type:complete
MRIKQEVWWIVEWNPTQNRVDIHREDDMRYVHFGEDCTNGPHQEGFGTWAAWEQATLPSDVRKRAEECWRKSRPTDPVETLRREQTPLNFSIVEDVIAAILKEREEHEKEVARLREAVDYASTENARERQKKETIVRAVGQSPNIVACRDTVAAIEAES